MNLYDLTTQRGAKRIGIDLGTLYATDVGYAREFAQRIHDHPAKFDGIQYESRHTQELCVVVWKTHNSALKKFALEVTDSPWDLAGVGKGIPAGSMEICETIVDVAAAKS